MSSIVITILKNVSSREIMKPVWAHTASRWLSQILKLDCDQEICPFNQCEQVSEPVGKVIRMHDCGEQS